MVAYVASMFVLMDAVARGVGVCVSRFVCVEVGWCTSAGCQERLCAQQLMDIPHECFPQDEADKK